MAHSREGMQAHTIAVQMKTQTSAKWRWTRTKKSNMCVTLLRLAKGIDVVVTEQLMLVCSRVSG